jgi:hypothetical protein
VVRETLGELGGELLGEAASAPRSKYFSVARRPPDYCGNIYRYAFATGRAERDI